MRAQIDIKMDRPIDEAKHYISPGGYEFELNDGSTIRFDFLEYEGAIDEDDKSVLHCSIRGADLDSFPDMARLPEKMRDVAKLSECYVYTGEDGEPEINFEKLLGFTLCCDINDEAYACDTPYVATETYGTEPMGADFTLTQKAIDEFNASLGK